MAATTEEVPRPYGRGTSSVVSCVVAMNRVDVVELVVDLVGVHLVVDLVDVDLDVDLIDVDLPAVFLFLISPIFPALLGHGLWTVDLALAGQFSLTFLILLILLKIFSTSFCIGFGFFGGVFAPALFLGVLVGGVVDLTLVSLDYGSSNFGILGAASCIGAVIGAPLAAVVIVFELTGKPSKLDAFIDLMRSLGDTEVSRTGVSAISRGDKTETKLLDQI